MKPISAVCTDKGALPAYNESLAYYLRFRVRLDNGEEQQFELQVDKDYMEIDKVRVLHHQVREGDFKPGGNWEDTELSDWHRVLFDTWKKNRESFHLKTHSERLEDTYLLSTDWFNNYSCEFKANYKPQVVQEEGESIECSFSAIPEMMYNAAASIYTYAASFFAYTELPKPYTFDGKYSSKFRGDIVDAIVAQINKYKRDSLNSFFNKDLKSHKADAFIEFLKLSVSRRNDSTEALIVAVEEKFPDWRKGTLSHESANLITKTLNSEGTAQPIFNNDLII
ncbi:MAG: hypothetical protein H0U73_11810 [Tatlockia sp.]|nr:hypothetical protein [Tatlockia sp.]